MRFKLTRMCYVTISWIKKFCKPELDLCLWYHLLCDIVIRYQIPTKCLLALKGPTWFLIQVFWYESNIDRLHTQKMNQHFLWRSIKNIEIQCYHCDANTRIFDNFFLNCFDVIKSLTELDGRLTWGKLSLSSRPSTFSMIP